MTASSRTLPGAFEEFYAAYYSRIVQYLKNRCSSKEDAEDLANTCFLYCMEHWHQFNEQKASRITWLYMIVRSRWKNYCRDHRQYVNLDDLENVLPDADILEQTVLLTQIRENIAEGLKELPDAQRTAIIMRFFQNCSDEEIALKLQTSRGNVRVMVHRALNRLQSVLPSDMKEGME